MNNSLTEKPQLWDEYRRHFLASEESPGSIEMALHTHQRGHSNKAWPSWGLWGAGLCMGRGAAGQGSHIPSLDFRPRITNGLLNGGKGLGKAA